MVRPIGRRHTTVITILKSWYSELFKVTVETRLQSRQGKQESNEQRESQQATIQYLTTKRLKIVVSISLYSHIKGDNSYSTH